MITSLQNPQVQKARKLHKRSFRNEHQKFLVEGVRGVVEALSSGATVGPVFVQEGLDGRAVEALNEAGLSSVEVFEVTRPVMGAISGTVTSPGVVALADFVDVEPAKLLSEASGLVSVLAKVRDPGNAGTILRTCRAAGVDALFVAAGSVDIYNPKFVRASAGALFAVRVARDADASWLLTQLGKSGFQRIATDPRGETVYHQLSLAGPTAFVFGNEAWGLADNVAGLVDKRTRIPMAGLTESLNVSIAAAVVLFEAARQREMV
ncbi:MAG: TrmH family RNA methyltransferase [Actinomycetota bacterium]